MLSVQKISQAQIDDDTRGDGETAERWWALEPRVGETLRAALERALRDAIFSGALRAGVRLPGSRRLARDLGVSRGVVSEAYEQLNAQGLLVTRGRSAPVVNGSPSAAPVPAPTVFGPPRYDLSPWVPDLDLFPLRRWLATTQRAARAAPLAVLGERETRGERRLREVLADHLGRTHGVIADPEQIVVTQGTAQSLDLVARVLKSRGARQVALEDPSPEGRHELLLAHGLSVSARGVDDDGLRVTGMVADAVIVTPFHQRPTGSTLSEDRRRELLAWARDTAGLIIEHDDDFELRFGSQPARALQSLAPESVVHLGGVATTLAPAIRLGWAVAPDALVDEIARCKRLADGFSPPLDQLTLAGFLASGDYSRHVRALRARYRVRREQLLEALDRRLPGCVTTRATAGIHLTLHLPLDHDDREVARRVARARIRVLALSPLCIERGDLNGLLIGYARLHEDAADFVVTALVDALRDAPRPRARSLPLPHLPRSAGVPQAQPDRCSVPRSARGMDR